MSIFLDRSSLFLTHIKPSTSARMLDAVHRWDVDTGRCFFHEETILLISPG